MRLFKIGLMILVVPCFILQDIQAQPGVPANVYSKGDFYTNIDQDDADSSINFGDDSSTTAGTILYNEDLDLFDFSADILVSGGDVKGPAADMRISADPGNTHASTGLLMWIDGAQVASWESDGDFKNDDDIYVGNDSGGDDDTLFFDAGAESIKWDNSPGEFDFSEDINLTGDLTISGDQNGFVTSFEFGHAASISAGGDQYLKRVDGVLMTANIGFVAPKAGSVMGISVSFDGTENGAPARNANWEIRKDGAVVYTEVTGISGAPGSDYADYGWQVRGTDTFTAGQTISVSLDPDSVDVSNANGTVWLMLD